MPSDVQDPFKEVAAFLVDIGTLNPIDADIYALGLKKFIITTADVIHEFPKIRQNTAGGRLQWLARNGYFENTLSDATKKKAPKKFKAVQPSVTMKNILSASARLNKSLAIIEEYYENPSQSIGLSEEDDIWQASSEEISISRGANMIRDTKQSVKICSNDCSWMKEPEIEEALKAVSGRIPVTVVANPDQEVAKELKKLGVELRRAKDIGIPFSILDDKTLLLVGRVGAVRARHTLLTTRQTYMVNKQREVFDRFVRHSKPIR